MLGTKRTTSEEGRHVSTFASSATPRGAVGTAASLLRIQALFPGHHEGDTEPGAVRVCTDHLILEDLVSRPASHHSLLRRSFKGSAPGSRCREVALTVYTS